jgi:Protein of unknown function (DUF3298)/Deacetylase PdaC
MKNLLVILFITIVLFSCGKKEGTTSDSKQTISETKSVTAGDGSLKFAEKKFFRGYNNCNPSDTCTYIEVNYIEAIDGKLKDKVNSFLSSRILEGLTFGEIKSPGIQAAADSFIASYADFKKQEPGYNQYWYFEYFIRVANETPALVCIEASNSSYMGGAHPNSYAEFFNISKETGDTVSLSQIFVRGFEAKLNKLIDAKYREIKGLKPDDNLQEKGELFENKIEFNYNFTVEKDGSVTFFYNTYEIAPYVAGPTDITLSKQELSSIIDPSGPLK